MKIVSIEEDEKKPSKKTKEQPIIESVVTEAKSRVGAGAYVITVRNMARRYSSEKNLEELIDWQFKEGNSYHIISQGDIDSLTYLRQIIKTQKVEKVILSTWCMSISDILEIERWIKAGRIGIIHFYIGEIFKNSYAGEYDEIQRLKKEGKADYTIFRNHSKVMCGHGESFSFVVESSANVNTNPRCENTVVTIDSGLCDFYINFFSKIKSIDNE